MRCARERLRRSEDLRHELEKDQAVTDENDNLKFDAQD